jgi:hypothetical protein
MSDWGKGVINNIGWGQGANNDIGWGSIYDKSNAGETLLKSDLNTDAFIIEVDTSKIGVSNNNQFQFTGGEGDYDVVAKQNDIVVATFNDLSNQETITLPSSGVYVLEVNAKEVNGFNRISFNNSGDKNKITDIKQWGNIVWASFFTSFRGCANLLATATDIPDLSSVTDIGLMFFAAISVNPNVLNWNVSNVNNFSLIFRGALEANPNMRFWDVSNAASMSDMAENSNISVENLTACYENWSQLNLQQNVPFSAGTTRYLPSGQEGRDILVNTYNWTITDGGLV